MQRSDETRRPPVIEPCDDDDTCNFCDRPATRAITRARHFGGGLMAVFCDECAADLARAEIATLRGAMAAADERLLRAGARVGIVGGCDTAEALADEVELLRAYIGGEQAAEDIRAALEAAAACTADEAEAARLRRLAGEK